MANKNQTVAVETEQQLNKTEAFFDKYKKAIIYGVLAVVVINAGIIVYNNYVSAPREDKASTVLAKGQQLFGEEQYEKALNGDGAGYVGFVKIASDYSSTDAVNVGLWSVPLLFVVYLILSFFSISCSLLLASSKSSKLSIFFIIPKKFFFTNSRA